MSVFQAFTKRRRFRPLAAVLAAALASSSAIVIGSSPADALTYHQWAIDANTVRVADAQEESWWQNGDEVQMGVIAFNTVLGTHGSTNAWYVGNNLQTLCEGADDGRVCAVPDSTGRANFGYRRSIGLADIAAGYKPTILGTIQVTIEEDETPDWVWEDLFRDLATITDQELTIASEGLSDADLSSLSRVTARFSAAAQRIQDRVQPDWVEQVGIFLASYGLPDEMIDFKITALVAVESALAPAVDAALAGALGDDGFAGALRTRSVVSRHAGEGAVDYVTAQVGTY
jgi:hypothetical protein